MLKNLEEMRTHLNAQGEAAVEIENAAIKTVEDHQAFVNWAMDARKHMRLKIEEVSAIISAHGEQIDDNFAELINKSQLIIDTLEGNPQKETTKVVIGGAGGHGSVKLAHTDIPTTNERPLEDEVIDWRKGNISTTRHTGDGT